MCYDWLKIEVLRPFSDILIEKLDWEILTGKKTGDITGKNYKAYLKIFDIKGCCFELTQFETGRVWISGSIHKYWNGNNYSSITLTEIEEAFTHLLDKFGIKLRDCLILKLEFGINVPIDFDPFDFINRLIAYGHTSFDRMGKIGRKFTLTEYEDKFYSKSFQCRLSTHVLRIERKVKDSGYLRAKGIYTLADLFKKLNVQKLANELLKIFNLFIFDDWSINENELTTKQQVELAKYRNSEYWCRKNKKQKNTLYRGLDAEERRSAKDKFRTIIKKYGDENYLSIVKENVIWTLELLQKEYFTKSHVSEVQM
ncbi:hypothetical protein [Chryseobacterium aurantiacum]|uniref:hypothetical protein n=1 Tax=Chryseobacterium aurantiacum TaxID=2116499 RepID=UPI000D117142|nr:hypothetical protein [Chryseobacterium aurantiacum]